MSGIPIGRLFGFEIRVHLSWVLVLALVAVLVVAQIEATVPDLAAPVRWIVGGVIAAAFLLSVLAHELGHGLVARRRGLAVGPITLYFFGGSASVEVEADDADDEAAVAAAGPVVSLVIGIVLAAAAFAIGVPGDPLAQALAAVALILGALNLILGAVNLLPAFPLDGGRLVSAFVWRRSGDRQRGARAGATSGRIVGWAFVLVGFAVIVLGNTIDGLMIGICGWFLGSTSRAMIRRLAVEEVLRGITVGEVMERDASTIPPYLTVDTFAEQILGDDGQPSMAVLRGDELLGVIGSAQLKRVGRGAWATTRAEQLMVAVADLTPLGPEESLWSAVDRLRKTGLDGLPVMDGSALLGMLTRRTVAHALQAQAEARAGSR